MTVSPLIDPDGLAAHLASAPPPVLLDVRWTLAGPEHNAYLAGHIPGAVFVDLDADLAGPPGEGGRHPLPQAADLQRVWRRAGIDDDTPVVVYDAANSSVAARCWWLLRWSGCRDVRVLDGGYAGWTAAGRPVRTGASPRPRRGTVTVRPGGMPTVDTDGAAAVGAGPGSVLLDARAPERYRGETEPVDPLPGHIPGAVNLPLTDLVSESGAFLPDAALTQRFAAAGLRPGGPIGSAGSTGSAGSSDTAPVAVASCGSGVTACHLVLAGAVIGLELALYPGSYSGWLAAGRAPVTTPRR